MQVVLIFGVAGACRREELTKMTIDDVEEAGSIIIVRVPDTKTNIDRTFTISSNRFFDSIKIYKKYVNLRPKSCCHRRLFVNFVSGKCSVQAVGINKIGKMPSVIASYLNLPDPSSYTGHCFRRTSATLLANSGASITNLKRHGGWRSTTVAEGYVENSISNKLSIGSKVLGEQSTNNNNNPQDNCQSQNQVFAEHQINNEDSVSIPGINISKCNNFTINLHINK